MMDRTQIWCIFLSHVIVHQKVSIKMSTCVLSNVNKLDRMSHSMAVSLPPTEASKELTQWAHEWNCQC